MENYYKILGLPDYCADQDQIKKAYRTQVKYYHPDSHNVSPEIAEEQTRKINAAYDVLSDPNKKAQYDNQLRYGASGPFQYTNQSAYSNAYNQGYGNQYANGQDPFSNMRGNFFFWGPFGPMFFRTGSGSRAGRSNPFWTIIKFIIIFDIISFLFRSCAFGLYNDRYYDDYYDGYRENPNAETGSAKLDLDENFVIFVSENDL